MEVHGQIMIIMIVCCAVVLGQVILRIAVPLTVAGRARSMFLATILVFGLSAIFRR
jgi:hypothetical protein